jgi:lipoic acid synthetase
MFRRIARQNPAIRLKTGLMLGLGETVEELLDTLADLVEAGCRMLTLGQYLQPSPAQVPVARYVPVEEFDRLGDFARRLGFSQVASGPLVRSSYHAREMMLEVPLDRTITGRQAAICGEAICKDIG